MTDQHVGLLAVADRAHEQLLDAREVMDAVIASRKAEDAHHTARDMVTLNAWHQADTAAVQLIDQYRGRWAR